MKLDPFLIVVGVGLSVTASAFGASSGPVFYGDPPDDHHPWAVHDRNRPQPPVVVPGAFSSPQQPGKPPSDAVVLFDGSDLSGWQTGKGEPAKWIVRDGFMEVKPGSGEIRTKREFGDCQLHVEWAPPKEVSGSSQGRGNSGVFLPGGLEIQVLDSYNNPTYADGGAGAYYGINPPLANALNPPGEWQVYDIVFRRPVYREGQVLDPGYVTVFMNGVLVQDHTPLEGPGGHMGRTKPRPFPEKGPLRLQDHGNPTRFRNIWYRELPPRPAQGGTDGYLTVEAATAKRHEIAAAIRAEAAGVQQASDSWSRMFLLMESLIYDQDSATLQQVEGMHRQYLAELAQLPADQLEAKKGDVRHLRDVLRYLTKWKVLPADYEPKAAVEKLIADRGWDKRPR